MSVPGPLLPSWRTFARDTRGVVSIIGIFVILLGVAMSVLVIDLGHRYLDRRRLQSAVDAAALAAAGDPANATAIATAILSANGYDAGNLIVTPGRYDADATLSPAARFTTGSPLQQNAVKVTKAAATPDYFAGMLGADVASDLAATATAAQMPSVSYAIGSGLASLDATAFNTLLGGLLARGGTGTTLQLSLLNYQGLAAANVDALGLVNAIASAAGISSGTYGDLANTNVTIGQFITAAQTVLSAQGGNTAAKDALTLLSVEVPAGVTATLGQVIDFSLWQKRQIGSIVQQDSGLTTINLLDIVTAMARVYGGGHIIDLSSTALAGARTLPLLAPAGTNVTAHLIVGSPMASDSVAEVGDSIATAQTRLALNITAANLGLSVAGLPLLSLNVSLPLYIELASGQASVAAIPCLPGGVRARITAQSQAASVTFGSVTDAQLEDFTHTVTPTPASSLSLTALGLSVATVKEVGTSTIAAGTPQTLNFTQSQITAGTVQSIAGSNTGLLAGLANATPQVSILSGTLLSGLLNGALSGITSAVKSTLAGLLTPLDGILGTVLQSLGLRLGTLDVVVRGVSCSRPTLVG